MIFYQLIWQYNLPEGIQSHPESLRHPQDTFQTPSRHPTDTRKQSTFWLIGGHWEKRQQLDMTTSIQLFMIYMTSQLLQTSARCDPDTVRHSQTPSRQPPDIGVSNYQRALEEKAIIELARLLYMFTNRFGIITSPDTLRLYPDTLRHNPDTPRHVYRIQVTRIKDNI